MPDQTRDWVRAEGVLHLAQRLRQAGDSRRGPELLRGAQAAWEEREGPAVEQALLTYERLKAKERFILVGTLVLVGWILVRAGILVFHVPAGP